MLGPLSGSILASPSPSGSLSVLIIGSLIGSSITSASPTGSEAMNTKTPGEQEVPDLNIDAFASRTVRLINNPMNLLDIKTAILNRIKNFLDENYGDQFVNRYLEILENEFGIETEEFDIQDMEQTSDDVFAVGANPGGAGMGG